MNDERWMSAALEEAAAAAAGGDVPVGAVVVRDERLIARGGNRRERDQDPTAHAEMVALRRAAAEVGTWRLEGCTMYVTLEPCAMCSGALVNSRIERLVYGAKDPKAGFCGSLGDLVRDSRLNHRVTVDEGILAQECGEQLVLFFERLRNDV